jgi:probable HAF family extracellular repeat protein
MGTTTYKAAILTTLLGALIIPQLAVAQPVMIDLGTLGANYSEATDINEHEQIVGYRITFASGEFRAFLWQDGVMTDLVGMDIAGGINNRGQIVGMSRNDQGEERAVLWQDGEITDLGTLGGTGSSASSIRTYA